jgi:hypothetical protein
MYDVSMVLFIVRSMIDGYRIAASFGRRRQLNILARPLARIYMISLQNRREDIRVKLASCGRP